MFFNKTIPSEEKESQRMTGSKRKREHNKKEESPTKKAKKEVMNVEDIASILKNDKYDLIRKFECIKSYVEVDEGSAIEELLKTNAAEILLNVMCRQEFFEEWEYAEGLLTSMINKNQYVANYILNGLTTILKNQWIPQQNKFEIAHFLLRIKKLIPLAIETLMSFLKNIKNEIDDRIIAAKKLLKEKADDFSVIGELLNILRLPQVKVEQRESIIFYLTKASGIESNFPVIEKGLKAILSLNDNDFNAQGKKETVFAILMYETIEVERSILLKLLKSSDATFDEKIKFAEGLLKANSEDSDAIIWILDTIKKNQSSIDRQALGEMIDNLKSNQANFDLINNKFSSLVDDANFPIEGLISTSYFLLTHDPKHEKAITVLFSIINGQRKDNGEIIGDEIDGALESLRIASPTKFLIDKLFNVLENPKFNSIFRPILEDVVVTMASNSFEGSSYIKSKTIDILKKSDDRDVILTTAELYRSLEPKNNEVFIDGLFRVIEKSTVVDEFLRDTLEHLKEIAGEQSKKIVEQQGGIVDKLMKMKNNLSNKKVVNCVNQAAEDIKRTNNFGFNSDSSDSSDDSFGGFMICNVSIENNIFTFESNNPPQDKKNIF